MSWSKVIVLCLGAPVGVLIGFLTTMKPSYEPGTTLCYLDSTRESFEAPATVEKYTVVADGDRKMLLRSHEDGREHTHWKTSDFKVCKD